MSYTRESFEALPKWRQEMVLSASGCANIETLLHEQKFIPVGFTMHRGMLCFCEIDESGDYWATAPGTGNWVSGGKRERCAKP